MPVIAVQHVAGEVVECVRKVLQRLDDRLGEVGKALSVVKEAVGVAAAEIALVVDEQVVDAFMVEAFEATVLVAPSKGT